MENDAPATANVLISASVRSGSTASVRPMAQNSRETLAIIHSAIAAEYTTRMGKKMNASSEKTEKTSRKSDAPTRVSSQKAITL